MRSILVFSSLVAVTGMLSTACNPDFLFGDDDWGIVIDFGRDCATDADCAGYTPPFAIFVDTTCNPGLCEDKRCTTRELKGSVFDTEKGDCHRLTCEDGWSRSEDDYSDVPQDAKECTVGHCSSW